MRVINGEYALDSSFTLIATASVHTHIGSPSPSRLCRASIHYG
jgi:hypothetical protein